MHTIQHVQEFHTAFGHPVNFTPTDPGVKHTKLRFTLILSELMELGRAIGVKGLADMSEADFQAEQKRSCANIELLPNFAIDHVEAADALGDLDYVVQGGNLTFGYPAEAVLFEIHRSNMSKLGADGKPILAEDGKVVKGPHYFKPNIANVLFG